VVQGQECTASPHRCLHLVTQDPRECSVKEQKRIRQNKVKSNQLNEVVLSGCPDLIKILSLDLLGGWMTGGPHSRKQGCLMVLIKECGSCSSESGCVELCPAGCLQET
jgi:hypothetical protein